MAWALNFWWIINLSSSDKAREEKKNLQADIFVYEVHDTWHTRLVKLTGVTRPSQIVSHYIQMIFFQYSIHCMEDVLRLFFFFDFDI